MSLMHCDNCGRIVGTVQQAQARADTLAALLAEARGMLHDCEEYFDQRADAEYFPDSPRAHPNEAMRLLTSIRDFLTRLDKEMADGD